MKRRQRQGGWIAASPPGLAAPLLLLIAGCAFGQVAALEQTAEQKTAEWDGLAKTLESKLARMLPCDPRVRSSIEDVRTASDGRLSALSQYLQAAAAQSRADGQAIAQLAAQVEAAGHEVDTERAEAEQERVAVEAQLTDLAASLKQRPQLAGAQAALEAIATLVRERASTWEQQSARRAALAAALRELQGAYQAREKAIQTEMSALVVESSRWVDYYAARIARSQTECTITNQGPADRQRKKK